MTDRISLLRADLQAVAGEIDEVRSELDHLDGVVELCYDSLHEKMEAQAHTAPRIAYLREKLAELEDDADELRSRLKRQGTDIW
jgi:septation ring formation regulator EzrA